MRDVTRLTNSLLLNLNKLIGEVELFDFLRLELLRLKYPSVYILLFTRTEEFLESTKGNNHEYTLQLKSLGDKKDINPEFNFCNSQLEMFIHQNFNSLSVPINEVTKIIHLIDNIFWLNHLFLARLQDCIYL